jgi:hypothetical protein
MDEVAATHEVLRQFIFTPEPCGNSSIYIPDAKQMHRIHGMVVNELFAVLQSNRSNKTIFNTQLIDLGVSDSNGKLEVIYEVKTENDRQSIYTAIGQLLFHSQADDAINKVVVLPVSKNGYEAFYNVFDKMGIWIAEWFIDGNESISFKNLPD